MFCTSFGGVGKHSNSWLVSGQHAVGLCGRLCDCSQLFRIRVLVQTAVTEYEYTVIAVLAVRNYHQEECGYEFCARFGL